MALLLDVYTTIMTHVAQDSHELLLIFHEISGSTNSIELIHRLSKH